MVSGRRGGAVGVWMILAGLVAGAGPASSTSQPGDGPAASAPATQAAGGPWPQWRGPTRDGQVPPAPWPSTLSGAALTPQWRVALGDGYASPILAADRVFVVESVGETERVRALDRATGAELWKTEWPGAMRVPFFAARNGSWVRCTPAYDGKYLYVGGMRDVLVALDAATGQVVWRVDFPQRDRTPTPAFGFVSSPLVDGDALYVQAGGAVVRLNKATGETVWRALADRGGMDSAFASPMIATLAGQRQLVVQTRQELAGVDLETGTVLWKTPVKAFRGMNILNPTVLGDRVFTSSYGGGSFAFDVRREGDAWSVKPAWSNRVQGYMSTPVVIGSDAYLHRRDQKVSCVDLATGTVRWTTPGTFGEYWSLVTNGREILALDQTGELLLLRADPAAFTVLDRRQVAEAECWAHVAVVGDEVYIREQRAMAAYRWREPAPTAP